MYDWLVKKIIIFKIIVIMVILLKLVNYVWKYMINEIF